MVGALIDVSIACGSTRRLGIIVNRQTAREHSVGMSSVVTSTAQITNLNQSYPSSCNPSIVTSRYDDFKCCFVIDGHCSR